MNPAAVPPVPAQLAAGPLCGIVLVAASLLLCSLVLDGYGVEWAKTLLSV